MLDYNELGLTQTITAQTTGGNALDTTRTFAGQTLINGVWITFDVCGSVDFVLDNVQGSYATVSGVFFDPPPAMATSATKLLVDPGGCASCGGSGGLSQVVAETDTSGNLTAVYVRDQDELLEVMRPGSTAGTWSTRFVHHDGLGSVRALTDETGTTTDTRGYEAFGTKNAEAGSDPLSYGFAGEPFDGTSTIAYHRARWMDARIGRFTSADQTAGEDEVPISWHRYVYAGDNPSTNVDPAGDEYDMASVSASVGASEVLSILATVSVVATAIDITCTAQQLSGVANPNCPNEYFYRFGTAWEPAVKLEAEASSAERNKIGIFKVKGLHGVSVVAVSRGRLDESKATATDIYRAGFYLLYTPTVRFPDHFTLILPKPVTEPVATEFNFIFGRGESD